MKTIALTLGLALAHWGNTPSFTGMPARSGPYKLVNQLKARPMETLAINIVSEFLTAVQQGNHSKLAALLHPEIEWDQPGNNRFAGIKKSSADVFRMVGGMVQATDNSLALSYIKVLAANKNSVACLVHWKAVQPNGGILDVDNIDVYTVENGQIVKAKVYSADIAQEDNFWLK